MSFWNVSEGAEVELLAYAFRMKRLCREARSRALRVDISLFPAAGRKGRAALATWLSAVSLFDDGVQYDSPTFFERARKQFARTVSLYKQSRTGINAKRRASGLVALPLWIPD